MPMDSEFHKHPDKLNVRETARRLGVHENTVRNWAARGVLLPIRLPVSGYRRFDAADVDRLAQAMRRESVPRPHKQR
jgi:DNA-binding transcriptional MerR regulator